MHAATAIDTGSAASSHGGGDAVPPEFFFDAAPPAAAQESAAATAPRILSAKSKCSSNMEVLGEQPRAVPAELPKKKKAAAAAAAEPMGDPSSFTAVQNTCILQQHVYQIWYTF